jgi:uncharacterized protein (DUF849 family)
LRDFASVNFHEASAQELAQLLLARSISVEAGISDVPTAEFFLKTGLAPRCLRILVEPQDQELDIARTVAKEILGLLSSSAMTLPPRLLHGFDETAWGLFDDAAVLGYQLRIGLEDTLRLPNGHVARHNAELVAEARQRLFQLTAG